MNESINEYKKQMKKGDIPRTYKFIMDFMSSLRIDFQKDEHDYKVSGLYQGYMDMTYFAVSLPFLSKRKLKIAIVFLHETCRVELWLSAANRKIAANYVDFLQDKDYGDYTLSQQAAGVDSILVKTIDEDLDFDDVEHMKIAIKSVYNRFIKDMEDILN